MISKADLNIGIAKSWILNESGGISGVGQSVLNFYNPTNLPVEPREGDKYISLGNANGWTLNAIMYWDGEAWKAIQAVSGSIAWISAIVELRYFNPDSGWLSLTAGGSFIPTIGTSTDTGLLRWNGITGSEVLSSGILLDNADNLSLPVDAAVYLDSVPFLRAKNSNAFLAGAGAVDLLSSGNDNLGIGNFALSELTSGISNIAIGWNSLTLCTTGSFNIGIGKNALRDGETTSGNIGIGSDTGGLGTSNIFIGASCGLTASGSRITAIGEECVMNSYADEICAFGYRAGSEHSDLSDTVYIGAHAGEFANIQGGTVVGAHAGTANTLVGITAIGAHALRLNNSDYGTAVGFRALENSETGANLNAFGAHAARNTTTGSDIIAIGNKALSSNTTGSNIISIGIESLLASNASEAVVIGYQAFSYNVSGEKLIGLGSRAGLSNTTGSRLLAIGHNALIRNSEGNDNIAIGNNSLFELLGSGNIAIGNYAAASARTAINNLVCGNNAMSNAGSSGLPSGDSANNTIIGNNAASLATAVNNSTIIGFNAGSNIFYTADNVILLQNPGTTTEANTIKIGTTGIHESAFLAGISGATTGGVGIPVIIDANGQLGTISSSRDSKQNIVDLDLSRAQKLLSMNFKQFEYKASPEIPQMGLIAEEVKDIWPDLVVKQATGVETIRYDMLLIASLRLLQEYSERIKSITKRLELLERV